MRSKEWLNKPPAEAPQRYLCPVLLFMRTKVNGGRNSLIDWLISILAFLRCWNFHCSKASNLPAVVFPCKLNFEFGRSVNI